MTNKDIARRFSDLAAIMELHGENPFKIRSYQNAYITLRKLDKPLSDMPRAEMDAIKGVGKAIGDKIQELLTTNDLQTYRKYADVTPAGVVEMLGIKGFGPKKILAVWQDLGIETVGELLYACNENRLIELHGFGKKTQEEIRKSTEYFLKSRGKLHFAAAEELADSVIHGLRDLKIADLTIEKVGELRRLMPVVEKIDLLVSSSQTAELDKLQGFVNLKRDADDVQIPIQIHTCAPDEWGSKMFKYTGGRLFLEKFVQDTEGVDFKGLPTEHAIFEKAQLPFIAPELRETGDILSVASAGKLPTLLNLGDIKGVIHAHTTWSDGINSISEMVHAAQHLGYQYLSITDHSKAAFYANGLSVERVIQQWAEIDKLQSELFNFKILKGIECDILNDGAMDYDADILRGFDLVIASVHSNLKMTEDKATARIIKAVENQYVTMLGHPTGRLLLSREGYPIDHLKVIDACAANKVCIE